MTLPVGRVTAAPRLLIAAAILGLVAYLVIGLQTLTVFPIVWMDEPWYTQSAWDFAERGTFTLPMFANLAGYDTENVLYGRLYLSAIAAAFEVGGVSVFTARLVSLASAIVALGMAFLVGRELWNARVGIAAAVILAVAPAFVSQSHDARPEIMLVAAWLTAFYVVLVGDRRRSTPLLFAGGLIAALTLDVHLNGIVFPAALLLVLMVRWSPTRGILAYLAGTTLGVVWFAWNHLMPEIDRFVGQVAHFTSSTPLAAVLADPLGVLSSEVARYVGVWTGDGAITVAVTVLAIAYLAICARDRSFTTLLVFGGVVLLSMTVGISSKTPVYAVVLWPLAALFVARAIDILPSRLAGPVTILAVAALLAGSVAQAVRLGPADYDAYVERISAAIPPSATVQGQPTLWFGMVGRPFVADHYFNFQESYAEAIRERGVEYIVVDEFFPGSLGLDRDTAKASEVEAFLQRETVLVAEFTDPFYGHPSDRSGGPFRTRVHRVLPDP